MLPQSRNAKGWPKARANKTMISGLPTIIASTMPVTIAQCPTTQTGSPNIPMDAKNNVTINVVSGRVSARICVANGETASSTPAAKAPNAGLRPTACVAHAEPVAMITASRTGKSRFLRQVGSSRSRGATTLNNT